MRLWHQDLIAKLPRQQLLGQHRECCAFVARVGNANTLRLTMFLIILHIACLNYHELIMQEMTERGYRVSSEWLDKEYRASRCEPTIGLKRRHYQTSFTQSMMPPIYRNVWTISSKKESSSKGVKRCIYLSG